MGVKKKKKSKKSSVDKEEKKQGAKMEKQESNLPEYNWIRLELKLCDPPTRHNIFRVVMRTDERIMEVKKRIIDYHGRVDNINVYNKDPYPPREMPDFRRQKKPRVPPDRILPELLDLM